jgi:hypothetical protein
LGVSDIIQISIGVQRIFEEERSPNGSYSSFDYEEIVEIFEEGVSEFEIDLGSLQYSLSQGIWLLRDGIKIIVISGKSIKRAQLEPSCA